MEATGDVALSLPPEWLLPVVRQRLCRSTELSGKKWKMIFTRLEGGAFSTVFHQMGEKNSRRHSQVNVV